MIKVLGSLLVFGGGGMFWWLQIQSRRRRRNVLADLMLALRRMQEEIRMMRPPLPELLGKLAEPCGEETGNLLREMAAAAVEGESVDVAWRTGVCRLPLSEAEHEILLGLSFCGDETKMCKEISLALYGLSNCAEELDHNCAEEEKRAAALCFAGAALLVILLI